MSASWRIRDHFPHLSDDVISNLRLFHVELLRVNQSLDLISNTTEGNADLLHFFDSIKASEFIAKDNPGLKEIYDWGTGSGFPGIVFAILNPTIKVHLVESDVRKADYLKQTIARAQITNAAVMNIKAENLNIKGPAVIMSRGLSNLARTLLLGSKTLEKKSILYSLKNDDWFSELSILPSQISSTWNNDMACEYELPESLGVRVVIKSVKIS